MDMCKGMKSALTSRAAFCCTFDAFAFHNSVRNDLRFACLASSITSASGYITHSCASFFCISGTLGSSNPSGSCKRKTASWQVDVQGCSFPGARDPGSRSDSNRRFGWCHPQELLAAVNGRSHWQESIIHPINRSPALSTDAVIRSELRFTGDATNMDATAI